MRNVKIARIIAGYFLNNGLAITNLNIGYIAGINRIDVSDVDPYLVRFFAYQKADILAIKSRKGIKKIVKKGN